jgi:hypothetical protein
MPWPASRSAAEILDELDRLKARDVDRKSGRAFSPRILRRDDVLALATEAHDRFLSANALNVAAFPSLR